MGPLPPALNEAWATAQRFTQRRQWDKAATGYRRITEAAPTFVPAWLELSSALERLDRYRESLACVLSAAQARGAQAEPMVGLAIARRLRRFEEGALLGRYIEATALHRRLPPDRLVELAMLLTSIGSYDQVADWLRAALQKQPALPQAHHMLGVIAMFAGDSDAAAEHFGHAIRLNPRYSAAYSILSRVKRAEPGSNRVADLRAWLHRPDLDPRDEVHFAYALHNTLHDLGDHDGAWQALTRAFRAKRGLQPYDHGKTLKLFEAQKALFDRYPHPAPPGAAATTPIFIVGMHRSGTTLLERILSGHPDIADCGETYTFTAQLRWGADHFCTGVADAALVEASPRVDFDTVGRRYLDAVAWRSRGCPYVTEKLNPNFVLLGQIASALPHARLVHIRRDAADTCFSNLRTLFTIEAAYSYDQLEVADYYRAYADLMAFWSERLGDRIHQVGYEALVESPAAESERLAAFCGIDYRDSMLDVSRADGMVATASTHHVRAGILQNRGRAWKPYEAHLAPMLDRLAAHGLA